MLFDTAEITIENLTSVQIYHSSLATVTALHTIQTILPDHFIKLTVPANTPVHLQLEKISFDNTFVDPRAFMNCVNTVVLKENEKLNMYFVGKVPDGPIECRYY